MATKEELRCKIAALDVVARVAAINAAKANNALVREEKKCGAEGMTLPEVPLSLLIAKADAHLAAFELTRARQDLYEARREYNKLMNPDLYEARELLHNLVALGGSDDN